MAVSRDDVIARLQPYFAERDEIAFAYLFGSVSTGGAGSDSDVDIGIYFSPNEPRLDIEESASFPQEAEIEADLIRLLGHDTDIVVMNRAPATLAAAMFYTGIPIVVRDEDLRLRFYLGTTKLAEEFWDFTRDYIEIKARSRSISEMDRNRLERILDFLADEIADVSSFGDLTRAAYTTESDKRRNVERWVENIVNASIDVAKTVVSTQGQPVPQTYRATLERLGYVEGFTESLAESLARNTRLRNILAHEYLDIRYPAIQRFLKEAPPLYADLIVRTRSFLRDQGSAV